MKTEVEYLSEAVGRKYSEPNGSLHINFDLSEILIAMSKCKSDAIREGIEFVVEEVYGRESYNTESNEQLTDLYLKRYNDSKL